MVPGGWASDNLRRYDEVTGLVRKDHGQGKIVGLICHAGWSGSRPASWPTTGRRGLGIRDDLVNAGATWVDEPALLDGNLVWGRVVEGHPGLLPRVGRGGYEHARIQATSPACPPRSSFLTPGNAFEKYCSAALTRGSFVGSALDVILPAQLLNRREPLLASGHPSVELGPFEEVSRDQLADLCVRYESERPRGPDVRIDAALRHANSVGAAFCGFEFGALGE